MPVFGFKAKLPARYFRPVPIVPCLCLDSRQNQHLTTVSFSANCTMPVFGFKAKRGRCGGDCAGIVPCLCLDSRQNVLALLAVNLRLYHACVWIQGKTGTVFMPSCCDCTMPVFGFKAKHAQATAEQRKIVPCLCLDSRQNLKLIIAACDTIVPCLCLDSRQNGPWETMLARLLYHACVWIQGKTSTQSTPTASRLYHACVWIQGKTCSLCGRRKT